LKDFAVSATAVSLGEDVLSYATAGRRIDLAHDVALRCLAARGASPGSLDLIVDCRNRVVADNEPPLDPIYNLEQLRSSASAAGARFLWLWRGFGTAAVLALEASPETPAR
jgi:hypothetical protein